MARVKYGAVIQDISGSVGGHTFQTNAYGATMRTKPKPPKSISTSQSARRAALLAVQAAWAGMSTADKSLWDLFGSFKYQGAKKNTGSILSGYNLFLKYNLIRYQFAGTILTTFAYTAVSPSSYASKLIKGTSYLYYAPTPLTPDSSLMIGIYLSTKTRILNRFDKASVRFIRAITFVSGNADLTAYYLAVFGALPSVADYLQLKEVIISLTSPIVFTPSGHITIVLAP
jgi:hypothetical protein